MEVNHRKVDFFCIPLSLSDKISSVQGESLDKVFKKLTIEKLDN